MSASEVLYVGVNDHEIDLFEGQFKVPNGMSYNSYVIKDEKIAVMDSVDAHFADEWLDQIAAACDGKSPDYLVVSHMEPDHSGSINAFMKAYPNATIVLNAKSDSMITNYFGTDYPAENMIVKNGDTLELGEHTLTFVFAPMVHWPEVMLSYDSFDKCLYSADAFGQFGALDVDLLWAAEARRYYFGIVAPYGKQVQMMFKKLEPFDIQMIRPLHGPVLEDMLDHYMDAYKTWSAYEPEQRGVLIAYASIYGHTAKAALKLAETLRKQGIQVVVQDLARCDEAQAVADAFRFSHMICAASSYNGGVFPFMRNFLQDLEEKKYQKRTVGFIQNGTWAPSATKTMKALLENCTNITFMDEETTIRGSVNAESQSELDALTTKLIAELK